MGCELRNRVEAVEPYRIDAQGMHHRQLNETIRAALSAGYREIILDNVNGQRYIGAGISTPAYIEINGVPGNDLAVFMNGPTIRVHGNGQDGIANTMNSGTVIVDGSAGDVLGYGMRGGRLFVRGDVGYRVGIHMKEYREQVPVLVVGGRAGAFCGEYMAGGVLVVLGLDRLPGQPLTGDYLATGMHGGVIYLRGRVAEHLLGKEVQMFDLNDQDWKLLGGLLDEFGNYFGVDAAELKKDQYTKLLPVSHRPYGRLYVS
ncbi:MAG: hypothetical protein H0Z39_06330 [Peptococcaceae bacterium]|nr:hypothetical protein [Peptococcaceae bacterium]